jgi:cell division protein FtsW (lipid II flippase)
VTTSAAFVMGGLVGFSFAVLGLLAVLMRFVQSDIDGFRRWLDKGGVT